MQNITYKSAYAPSENSSVQTDQIMFKNTWSIIIIETSIFLSQITINRAHKYKMVLVLDIRLITKSTYALCSINPIFSFRYVIDEKIILIGITPLLVCLVIHSNNAQTRKTINRVFF